MSTATMSRTLHVPQLYDLDNMQFYSGPAPSKSKAKVQRDARELTPTMKRMKAIGLLYSDGESNGEEDMHALQADVQDALTPQPTLPATSEKQRQESSNTTASFNGTQQQPIEIDETDMDSDAELHPSTPGDSQDEDSSTAKKTSAALEARRSDTPSQRSPKEESGLNIPAAKETAPRPHLPCDTSFDLEEDMASCNLPRLRANDAASLQSPVTQASEGPDDMEERIAESDGGHAQASDNVGTSKDGVELKPSEPKDIQMSSMEQPSEKESMMEPSISSPQTRKRGSSQRIEFSAKTQRLGKKRRLHKVDTDESGIESSGEERGSVSPASAYPPLRREPPQSSKDNVTKRRLKRKPRPAVRSTRTVAPPPFPSYASSSSDDDDCDELCDTVEKRLLHVTVTSVPETTMKLVAAVFRGPCDASVFNFNYHSVIGINTSMHSTRKLLGIAVQSLPSNVYLLTGFYEDKDLKDSNTNGSHDNNETLGIAKSRPLLRQIGGSRASAYVSTLPANEGESTSDSKDNDGSASDSEVGNRFPKRKHLPWTEEENNSLLAWREGEKPKDWAEIARLMPNRSEGAIRTHWYLVFGSKR